LGKNYDLLLAVLFLGRCAVTMNLESIDVEVLAADYKARMIPSNEIYSLFVQDRNLKPEITAKQLLVIVENAYPSLLKRTITSAMIPTSELTHEITHHDGYTYQIKLTKDTGTVLYFQTEYGGTGSTPKSLIKELKELD
jgi:hypothetical protein